MTVHPIKLGKIVANCYLIQEDDQFMLVDTGRASKKRKLMKALADKGCRPGDLKLILMTHGHFDHTGLGAHFQQTYGTRIIMHQEAAKKVITGDMFHGSTHVNRLQKAIVNRLFKIQKFAPHIQMKDSLDISSYGFSGKVIATPGHSNGSVCLLLKGGHLICGDLFENSKSPKINSIIEDKAAAKASYKKLQGYKINKVYPGHGDVFEFDQVEKSDS